MKKSRFSEEPSAAGDSVEEGRCGSTDWGPVPAAGLSEGTFYRWKAKYDGLEVSQAKRLRQLEEETGSSTTWWPS